MLEGSELNVHPALNLFKFFDLLLNAGDLVIKFFTTFEGVVGRLLS